jgi:hypothetical protein
MVLGAGAQVVENVALRGKMRRLGSPRDEALRAPIVFKREKAGLPQVGVAQRRGDPQGAPTTGAGLAQAAKARRIRPRRAAPMRALSAMWRIGCANRNTMSWRRCSAEGRSSTCE